MCEHAHVHVCMHGTPSHTPIPTPTPIHPPTTPQGQTSGISKNSITLDQDSSIPFEDLKSVETPPPMGGCMVWWVGGSVDGSMGGVRSNH